MLILLIKAVSKVHFNFVARNVQIVMRKEQRFLKASEFTLFKNNKIRVFQLFLLMYTWFPIVLSEIFPSFNR